MRTNCPNCGAVLDKNGHCDYCGTNVVHNLDIFYGTPFAYGSIVELNLNITDPHGNTNTIPLRGSIGSVELTSNFCGFNNNTEVEFTFTGVIREDD